jgi:hypothetical protein
MAINPATGKPYETRQESYDPKTGITTVNGVAQTPTTPTTPTVAPTTPTPTVPTTTEITAPVDNTAQETAGRQGTFVTYDPLTGKVVSGSRKALEVGTQGANQYLETPINGADPDWQSKYIVTHKSGNTLYGILKPQAPKATETSAATGTTTQAGPTATTPTALDSLRDMADSYLTDKASARSKAMEDAGVAAIQAQMQETQTKFNDLLARIDKKNTEIDAENILNEEAKIALKDKIEGKAIPMSDINRQLLSGMENLEQAQRLDRLYDTYEINTVINEANAVNRNLQLQQGNYKAAMENVQASMDDWGELQQLRLAILDEQGKLEAADRARYESEIDYQRNLAMQGMVPVESDEAYNAIVKDLGVTAETFSTFFYKDPANGKVYLRSAATGDEKAYVTDLMTKYPDAGINFKDTVESAQAKLSASKIYAQQTRLAGGGSGSGSGGSGTIRVGSAEIPETGDTFTDTVNYLRSLRDQDMLTDYNYEEQINALMENIGADPSRRGEIQSAVNSAMEGGTVEDVAETVVDSWTEDEPTKTYAEQGLGLAGTDAATFGKEYVKTTAGVTGVPWLLKKAGELGEKASNYLTGK